MFVCMGMNFKDVISHSHGLSSLSLDISLVFSL